MKASATFIGITDHNTVEIIALKLGLNLCKTGQIDSIVIQIDLKFLLSCLNRQEEATPHQQPVLEETRRTMDAVAHVTISFVYQEENAVADHLAKEASKRTFGRLAHEGTFCNNFSCFHFIWDICTAWLSDVIAKDSCSTVIL